MELTKRRTFGAKRRALTDRLYIAQGGLCYLCGRAMFHPVMQQRPKGMPRRTYWRRIATFDHLWPRALTGAGQGLKAMIGAMACARCNSRKGCRKPRPCEVLYVDAIFAILDAMRSRRSGAREVLGQNFAPFSLFRADDRPADSLGDNRDNGVA